MKRFKNAHEIWNNGASNPRAVARALVEAIDEACVNGSAHANDPAVHLILDQLCFLCGMPQPSLDIGIEAWHEELKFVEEMK